MLHIFTFLLVPLAIRHTYLLLLLLPVVLIFGIRVGVYRLRRPKRYRQAGNDT